MEAEPAAVHEPSSVLPLFHFPSFFFFFNGPAPVRDPPGRSRGRVEPGRAVPSRGCGEGAGGGDAGARPPALGSLCGCPGRAGGAGRSGARPGLLPDSRGWRRAAEPGAVHAAAARPW